ncbi:hypothetical protein [Microtetraspora sp. NBRC 13810]|uniref:hypothetical protein n=1 Tax=Microtetraspora sp. NBRC 13810 TaxID=3030990 RepID=UPI00255522F4|nr:hypothetical protein [Microtetraspora sp. NBRC 13810]
MRDRSDRLPITTTSDYERGKAWPRYEWVAEFVVVCLRHRLPQATRAQLDAELVHWQRAWTYTDRHRTAGPATASPEPAHHTAPPPEGAVPVPDAVPTLAPPASPPHPPETPGGAAPDGESPRRAQSARSWWWVGAVAVAVLAGGVVVAVRAGVFGAAPDLAASEVAGPASAVLASGAVEALGTKEGMDLDTGQRNPDQNAAGVDISFSSSSTHLDAMSTRVSYVALPAPVPEQRHHCAQATGYVRWYAHVYTLTEGRNVCVKTDEGRLSMLTITRRATEASGSISFRYVTWP